MRTLCIRCALRLQIAEARTPVPGKRTFSSTPAKRKIGQLPKFTETSQPELDDVLASLRYKHLLPTALSNTERNLVYKPKHKQQLVDYPVVATIGGEEITLEHINRLSDVPSLKKEIIPKAIKLMAKGEPADWNQLPAMLTGLKKAKLTPRYDVMGKIARKAVEAGRFGIVLQCLHQASRTDMTLRKPEVLHNVLYALRHMAQSDGWSEQATARAIRDANEVAKLMENEAHGTGKLVRPGDPRTRPHILAVFLELSVVYAHKYHDGKDVDGKVKAYAERLLSNIESNRRRIEEAVKRREEETKSKRSNSQEDDVLMKSSIQPATTSPRPTGPQMEILKGVPIWHSLRLARKILGNDMPMPGLAQEVVKNWGEGLEKLTQGLKTQATEKNHGLNRWPKSGTYGWQALKVYRSCLKLEDEA